MRVLLAVFLTGGYRKEAAAVRSPCAGIDVFSTAERNAIKSDTAQETPLKHAPRNENLAKKDASERTHVLP